MHHIRAKLKANQSLTGRPRCPLLERLPGVAALALILGVWGWLGQDDYEHIRMQECADQGLRYDAKQDECYLKYKPQRGAESRV